MPEDPEFVAELFTLLFEQGRRDEAFDLIHDNPTVQLGAELLNDLSGAILRVGGNADDLARAEVWSRTAVDRGGSDVPAYAHTYASILGKQGKWEEALTQTPLFLTSEWAGDEGFDDSLDFLIEAVAAGHEVNVVRRIKDADLEEAFEPLITAVRYLSGAELDVAREISEIARDVVRRIQQKRGATALSGKAAAPDPS
jgi:hypothetical protein